MTSTSYGEAVRKARAIGETAIAVGRKASMGELMAGGPGGGSLSFGGGGSNSREMRAKLYQELVGWVFTAMNAIATRLSGQPYGCGKLVGEQPDPESEPGESTAPPKKPARGMKSIKGLPLFIKQIMAEGQGVESYAAHEAIDFLNQPNPVQSKREFLWTLVANLFVTGEAYVIAGEIGGGKKKKAAGDKSKKESNRQMWCIPTPWLTPKHEGTLFSGYELKTPGMSSGMPVPAEAVKRMYFPDPNDPKGSTSPLMTQIMAVRTDQSIQKSQKQSFDRGIVPNIMLTVGEIDGPNGKVLPTLTGDQRRQLVRAVREIWQTDMSDGVAIIDGLISSIDKLSQSPSEMDWMQSGESVKKRIFQAFGINPVIVGEIAGVNRATAAVADKIFCQQTINPIIDSITGMLNTFVAPMFEEGLYLWLELATPQDEELKTRQYQVGLSSGAVSNNEYRTEVLGLPPMEGEAGDKSPLLGTVGGMTGTVAVLSAVGMGQVSPEAAQAIFEVFLGLDPATASRFIEGADDLQSLQPPPAGPPGLGPPKPADDSGDAQDNAGEDDGGDGPPIPDMGDDKPPKKLAKRADVAIPKLSRGAVKAARLKTQQRLEEAVGKSLIPFFGNATLRQLSDLVPPDRRAT